MVIEYVLSIDERATLQLALIEVAKADMTLAAKRQQLDFFVSHLARANGLKKYLENGQLEMLDEGARLGVKKNPASGDTKGNADATQTTLEKDPLVPLV